LSEPTKHVSLIRIDVFRLTIASFFFLYAYVVAQSLIPLPDEPPRINFWGVFCVTGGVVIGFHVLISRYRLFLIGTWFFLLIAHWQIGKKVKFLEMMLEPKALEIVTQYALGVVLLALLTPRAFQTFDRAVSERDRTEALIVKKGIPF